MSNRELSLSRARWQVLVDFDGTVAPNDPTDRLLERFEPENVRAYIADKMRRGK